MLYVKRMRSRINIVALIEQELSVYLNYFAFCVFMYLFMLQPFNSTEDLHHPVELVNLHRNGDLVHLVYVERAQ